MNQAQAFTAWTTFSIGIFIVWAIIFIIRWRLGSPKRLKDLPVFFAGFFIGWLTATIKFIIVINKL